MIRGFIKYWLPVVIWLAVIFSASADKSSGHRSSRIIGPLVRWLVPDISQKKLDAIVYSVRKVAHMSEYAVLALLLFRALARPGRNAEVNLCRTTERSVFPVRSAIFAFLLSVVYAMTDEFHQTFVPSREGQITDVLIDSLGAAAGLFALWLVGRCRKSW